MFKHAKFYAPNRFIMFKQEACPTRVCGGVFFYDVSMLLFVFIWFFMGFIWFFYGFYIAWVVPNTFKPQTFKQFDCLVTFKHVLNMFKSC